MKLQIVVIVGCLLLTSCGAKTEAELRAEIVSLSGYHPTPQDEYWDGCEQLSALSEYENGYCQGQYISSQTISFLAISSSKFDNSSIGSELPKSGDFSENRIRKICEIASSRKGWEGSEALAEYVRVKDISEFQSGCEKAIGDTYPLFYSEFTGDYGSEDSQADQLDISTPACELPETEYNCDDQYINNVELNGGYYASLGDISSELNMASKFCEYLDNGTTIDEWIQMGMSAKPGDEDWTLFLTAIGAAALISYCPEYQDQALN